MDSRIILLLTLASVLFLVSVSAHAQEIPVCNDITPITDFYPLTPTKILTFNTGGSDSSTQIEIPTGLHVYSASMNVTGIPIPFLDVKKPVDIIVVNDVSGSMDDNCGPDGIAQPGETPCKINDMKEATKSFLNVLLNYTDNDAGLVSYSTKVVSWMDLTDNKAHLFDEIDTYVAMNETCIACGIDKGIQLLKDSEKPVKAMVLMTDGIANRCTYGVCTPYMAKQQALNKAAQAWVYYNISIYTVAFGEDADTELMQQIAEASNGYYYYAAETDIVDVYNMIANDMVISYPTNPIIDIGMDGVDDWSYTGELKTKEHFDFTSDLQSLVDCTCPGCTVMGDECLIDVEVSTDTAGQIFLDWLEITGCVIEPPECYDLDGDGYNAAACGGNDCDDSNYDVNPGAAEVCGDEIDNNCDGYVDEGCYIDLCEGVVCESYCSGSDWYYGYCVEGECAYDVYHESENCLFYPDNDEDGYDIRTDCNDNNPNVHPGALEVCNGIDDDCDGTIDEGCGGGGGGIVITGLCLPSWDCSDWSECVEGQQTRTCTDSYNCNTNYDKPHETQDCQTGQPPAFVCVEGSRSCLVDNVIECVGNEWKDVETCAWGCDNGACNPRPEEVTQEETAAGGAAGFITAGSPEFWAIIIAIIVILVLLWILWRRGKKPKKPGKPKK